MKSIDSSEHVELVVVRRKQVEYRVRLGNRLSQKDK